MTKYTENKLRQELAFEIEMDKKQKEQEMIELGKELAKEFNRKLVKQGLLIPKDKS